jgi:hypothetical protein
MVDGCVLCRLTATSRIMSSNPSVAGWRAERSLQQDPLNQMRIDAENISFSAHLNANFCHIEDDASPMSKLGLVVRMRFCFSLCLTK